MLVQAAIQGELSGELTAIRVERERVGCLGAIGVQRQRVEGDAAEPGVARVEVDMAARAADVRHVRLHIEAVDALGAVGDRAAVHFGVYPQRGL